VSESLLVARDGVTYSFQSKKDVALVFNNLLRRQIGTRSPTVEYLCARPEILIILIKGWVVMSAFPSIPFLFQL
jgi:calcium binding protein 39